MPFGRPPRYESRVATHDRDSDSDKYKDNCTLVAVVVINVSVARLAVSVTGASGDNNGELICGTYRSERLGRHFGRRKRYESGGRQR